MTVSDFVKNCKSESGVADKYNFYINGKHAGRTDYFRGMCDTSFGNRREIRNISMKNFSDGTIAVFIETA